MPSLARSSVRARRPSKVSADDDFLPNVIVNGGRRGLQAELAAGDLVRVLNATAAELC